MSPDDWKKRNVVSIYKKEYRDLIKTCWLVSLLRIFRQVFERLVFDTLFNYFMQNKLHYFLSVNLVLFKATVRLFNSYQLRSSFTKVLIVIHCDLHWSFDDIWQSLWEIFVIWIEILWRRWDILLKSVEMYFKKLIAQCCFKWSDFVEEEHTGWGFSVFCDRISFILNLY